MPSLQFKPIKSKPGWTSVYTAKRGEGGKIKWTKHGEIQDCPENRRMAEMFVAERKYPSGFTVANHGKVKVPGFAHVGFLTSDVKIEKPVKAVPPTATPAPANTPESPAVPSSVPTLAEYFPRYLEQADITPSTKERFQHAFKSIGPYLGHLRLNEITSRAILAFRDGRKTESYRGVPINPRTVNWELQGVSAILSEAIKREIIPGHPFRSEAKPLSSFYLKYALKPPTVLSPEELQALYQAATNSHAQAVLLFLALTGMRKSELSILKIQNLDLKARKITLNAPKTKDFRTIPMGDALYSLCARLVNERPDKKGWKARSQGQEFVFCDNTGAPYKTLGWFLPALAKKAGITRISVSPHVLRHSFSSSAAQYMSVWELQKHLGHKDPKTTALYVRQILSAQDHAKIADTEKVLGLPKTGAKGLELEAKPEVKALPLEGKTAC